MKLNLGLIADLLIYRKDYVRLGEPDSMKYSDVYPYVQDKISGSSDIIYIMKWNELRTYGGTIGTVMCVGGGDEAKSYFKSHDICGIVFDGGTDILSLLIDVRGIFNRYNKLELELLRQIGLDATTRTLLNICGAFFNAFVSLFGIDFALLEHSDTFMPPSDSEMWNATFEKRRVVIPMIPREKVQMQPGNSDQNLHSTYINIDGLEPHFNYGLDDGDSRFATLIITETAKPLMPSQHWLADYIGDLILPKMTERYNTNFGARNRLRTTLQYMLNHRSSDALLSFSDFTKYKWLQSDYYRLLIVSLPIEATGASHFLYNYENIFAKHYHDTIAFHFAEQIVIILHNDACEISEECLETLRKQIEMDHGTCAVSMKFSDFTQIPVQYGLALYALRIYPSDENVRFYNKILPLHIIKEVSTVAPVRSLCHWAAVAVNNYDRENGTDFLYTLEIYLLNNKSLIEASNKLFVHKSTITYRLKCIEKIAHIDYDSSEERLAVLLSCIILRSLNQLNT